METNDLINYYVDLLILQYRGMPNARAHMAALVDPVIMSQLPAAVREAFNIDTASGVQLDILGKYAGASRSGYGIHGQPITLSDSDYRKILKIIIIQNNAGSSLYEIQRLLAVNFQGQIFITDNKAMGMNYILVDTIGTSDLLEMIQTGGLMPRPMGVSISVSVLAPSAFPYFGFRTYSGPEPVSPFNSYISYQMTFPWLSYSVVG